MCLSILLLMSNSISNLITIICCFIILGVSIYYFSIVFKLSNRFLSKFSKKDIDYENIFNQDKILSPIILEYKKSTFLINGKIKTNIKSSELFNRDYIFSGININSKHIFSASGMLVGLGVLGTFIGLSVGIAGFDSTSSQTIQSSIDNLLGGMGTAFSTSLLGMLCSSIYIVLEKTYINRLDNILNHICSFLDEKYYINEIDMLTNYLSYENEQGNKILLSNTVRDLYIESHKQTGYIGSLVDDLSNAIDDKLSRSIKNDVLPLISEFSKTLNDKIDLLKSSMQSPAEDLTSKLVAEISKSINDMTDRFSKDLSGSAKNDMEKLSSNLSTASNSLNELPNQLATMVSQLNLSFGGIHSTIEDLENAVKKIVENSAGSNFELLEKTNAQYDKMNEANHRITGQTDILINNFNNMMGDLNTTISQIGSTMIQIKEIKNGIGSLVANLSGIAINVNSATSNFKDSQLQFVNEVRDIQTKNTETVTDITDLLEKSNRTVHEYADEFNIIKQGLSNIFDQIKKGLDQYSTTVSSDAQSVLNGYSSSLNEGIKALQQAISSLSDLVTGLTDEIEDFKKRKE